MITIQLGRTGLDIHPLVFGTLPLGPLQADLPAEEGGALIRYALESGVTLVDTAELYGTYAHIRQGLSGYSGIVKIATKTHATDAATARQHTEKALHSLDRNFLDIVHLHGARLSDPFVERADVLDELLRMQDEGLIGHIGLSTHYVCAVWKAIGRSEISVLHPLINQAGRGLLDGTAEDMAAAIAAASSGGQGVYAMKALGGGTLICSAHSALTYVRDLPGVHALALGMLSMAEIDANLAFLENRRVSDQTWDVLEQKRRRLQIMVPFCKGCGACVDVCTEKGLKVVDGKAQVDNDACVLCGYCAASCPEFIIRVV